MSKSPLTGVTVSAGLLGTPGTIVPEAASLAVASDSLGCVCACAHFLIQVFVPQSIVPSRLLCSWDFPGKSTGVGSHSIL